MDTNTPVETIEKYTGLADEELLKMYDDMEEENPEFDQVKEELAKRGFSFVSENAEEAELPEQELGKLPARPVFSSAGILAWEIAYPLLAVAGVVFFLVTLTRHGESINTRLFIGSSLVVLLIGSCGALVGAIRRFANLTHTGLSGFAKLPYLVISGLWLITTLGAFYYLSDTFAKTAKLSMEYALFASLIPMLGTLLSLAFTFAFYSLGKAASKSK